MTSSIAKAAIGKEYAGSLITLKAFLLKMAHAECPFCAIVLTLNKMSPRDRDVFTAHLIAVHGLHLNSRAELA